ncbi:hypothetical protein [Spiroplasma taiwanense]|uniref:Uncharacterized protein n=1 Tax=Spiroplasma taiwanense CT-1 TaxID=1276220 RepID=S5MC77_9MOLU|nr:hypothetical protein [Spiroplasma taiwanense]AGR41328.1 hypothetical protein STAIW_v1c07140 [Spiroplasma taiwanense CT-1]
MSNDKSWVLLLSDEKITYNDIYSIFINFQEFMLKENWYSAFINNLINIQKFYDDLINSFDLLNGVADATNELSKKMQDKNNEKAVKEIKK